MIAALVLSQNPVDALRADGIQLARDMVDGQICEAVHGGSMKDAYFTETMESLSARTATLQVDRNDLDHTFEVAYKTYMAEFEAEYPGEPSDENIAEIRTHCQNLQTTRSEMLGPYQGD